MAEDRRVRKTRRRIKEAMLRCLQDTPLKSVTVKAICDEADINRSTFYAHYPDPFALYDELQEEIVEEMTRSLVHIQDTEDSFHAFLLNVVRYTQEHQAAFLALVKNDVRSLQQTMTQAVQRLHLPSLEQFGDRQVYVQEYFYSGTVAMLSLWLEGGGRETPEEMAGLLEKILV